MKDSSSTTMQCGTCNAPGDFQLVDREIPQTAKAGWVLLDVAAIGLCGTDYHIYEGAHPFLEYPRVIGHELSGFVAESAEGWKKGELVVVNPYLYCGECRACKRGKTNCCANIQVLGVHRDGGMCSRIEVPATNLYSGEGLTPIEASMIEFLTIGAHAVRRSEIVKGDRVLVTGAGPIGIGTALFARLQGAEVHIMDLSDARLDAAQEKFGFTLTYKAGTKLLQGELHDGFDAVFDATGNRESIEAGFELVAHGGSYVLVSVVKGDVSFVDAEFHKREMRLIGSRNSQKIDFENVIDAIKNKLIDSTALCSERIELTQMPARFPSLVKNREDLIKAVVYL